MRRLWIRVTGAACLAAAFSMPAHASFQIQSWIGIDGPLEDHRCIQPADGTSSWNGTVITLQPCDPYDALSLWDEEFLGWDGNDTWKVQYRNVATGLCLDLKDNNTADHTPIKLWECNGSTSQFWAIDPNYDDKRLFAWRPWRDVWDHFFAPKRGFTVIDVRGGSSLPGTVIQNYGVAWLPDGSYNPAQWWRYLPR